MKKVLDENEVSGNVDQDLAESYRKHNNYCKRLQKKVMESKGNNITPKSTINQIWKEHTIMFRPEIFASNQIKNHCKWLIEVPKIIIEEFVSFFKKKGNGLADKIKSNSAFDP